MLSVRDDLIQGLASMLAMRQRNTIRLSTNTRVGLGNFAILALILPSLLFFGDQAIGQAAETVETSGDRITEIDLPSLVSLDVTGERDHTVTWVVENTTESRLSYMGSRVSCACSNIRAEFKFVEPRGDFRLTATISRDAGTQEDKRYVSVVSEFHDSTGEKYFFTKRISVHFRPLYLWLKDESSVIAHRVARSEILFQFSDACGQLSDRYEFVSQRPEITLSEKRREKNADGSLTIHVQASGKDTEFPTLQAGHEEEIPIQVFKYLEKTSDSVLVSETVNRVVPEQLIVAKPDLVPTRWLEKGSIRFVLFSKSPSVLIEHRELTFPSAATQIKARDWETFQPARLANAVFEFDKQLIREVKQFFITASLSDGEMVTIPIKVFDDESSE